MSGSGSEGDDGGLREPIEEAGEAASLRAAEDAELVLDADDVDGRVVEEVGGRVVLGFAGLLDDEDDGPAVVAGRRVALHGDDHRVADGGVNHGGGNEVLGEGR